MTLTQTAPTETPATPALAAPAAGEPLTLRLTLAKAAALRQLKARIEQGIEIRRRRIRYAEDLEEVRTAKAAWVQSYTEVLKGLFHGDAGQQLADRCNDWTGRVFPEYAQMELFVEQFYEEMDYRITRLRAVAREVAGMPEAMPIRTALIEASAAVVPVAAVSPSTAETPVAKQDSDDVPAVAQADSQPVEKVIVIHDDLSQAAEAVLRFVADLGLSVQPIRAANADGASTVQALEQGRSAGFAVMLLGPEHSAALRNANSCPPSLMFQLGYLTGQLGLQRVCVLCDAVPDAFHDAHGIACLPRDAANGWQLQLARRLKRAGIEVDLNKLC